MASNKANTPGLLVAFTGHGRACFQMQSLGTKKKSTDPSPRIWRKGYQPSLFWYPGSFPLEWTVSEPSWTIPARRCFASAWKGCLAWQVSLKTR